MKILTVRSIKSGINRKTNKRHWERENQIKAITNIKRVYVARIYKMEYGYFQMGYICILYIQWSWELGIQV